MIKKKMLAQVLLAASLVFGGVGVLDIPKVEAATAEVERSVSLRTAPSTSADRIRYLRAGETLQIVTKVNYYWYKVKDSRGQNGYVSSSSRYLNVGGNSDGTTVESGSKAPTSKRIQNVIAAGKSYLGTPYEFGSSRFNTRTFDCSDFVRQAFKEGAGITLPSNSREQAAYVKRKGNTTRYWSKLKPGDIMFFMSYRGTDAADYRGIDKSKQRITHDGIYLGNGKILHTFSRSLGGVRIDSIDNKHWEYRFIFGGSAL
jgi:cell wall-associated NlpC family hydrolase